MHLNTNLKDIKLNFSIINEILLDIDYWATDNPDFDDSILDIITHCIQDALIKNTNFNFQIELGNFELGSYKYQLVTFIINLPFILNNIQNCENFDI